jgi:hypothetical protein
MGVSFDVVYGSGKCFGTRVNVSPWVGQGDNPNPCGCTKGTGQ